MERKLTEQEEFWMGAFGGEYIERNRDRRLVRSNIHLFSRILSKTRGVNSVLEFGSNIGLNLVAISYLLGSVDMAAVEINREAAEELKKNLNGVEVYNISIFDFSADRKWDLVFTKGVLIHLNPDRLTDAYRIMHEASSKYILVAEYYNPTPVEVPYRGHNNRLFKRDFAGEMLDMFPDLVLVDYGFVYHRDYNFPLDDISWFLMEKRFD